MVEYLSRAGMDHLISKLKTPPLYQKVFSTVLYDGAYAISLAVSALRGDLLKGTINIGSGHQILALTDHWLDAEYTAVVEGRQTIFTHQVKLLSANQIEVKAFADANLIMKYIAATLDDDTYDSSDRHLKLTAYVGVTYMDASKLEVGGRF